MRRLDSLACCDVSSTSSRLAATARQRRRRIFRAPGSSTRRRARSIATAGIIGLIPAGAPKTLHITQPANGTVVIESQINEAHVRIYRPGTETSTPAGQGGAVTMTTKWDGTVARQ